MATEQPFPASAWDAWLAASLDNLTQRNLVRTLRATMPGASAVEVHMPPEDLEAWAAGAPPPPSQTLPMLAARPDLRTVKLFSLNDYLGLSCQPDVRRAAADAALACGSGPRASALVAGYTARHRDLEAALAALCDAEDCLLFPTGFAANLAVVAALCSNGDVDVFSDELNHASIVDGARLARGRGAALHIYGHNDLQDLDRQLEKAAAERPQRRRLVVTDTLFSMDGDFADLKGLDALRRRHGFLLVGDEAHATLACGPTGGGAAQEVGVELDLHVGTLSKAVGSVGGFLACSRQWKRLLVNEARTQVFSTALPAPAVAAAAAALRVAAEEPWRRERVWKLARMAGRGLGVPARSYILPFVLGSEEVALAASAALLRRGLHVPAIRPPTVAPGTSRLRVSLSAAHSDADVEALVAGVRMAVVGWGTRSEVERLKSRL
jgi:8-amino-7-oxononanoate synthase